VEHYSVWKRMAELNPFLSRFLRDVALLTTINLP